MINTHLGACAGATSAALLSVFLGRPILMTATVNASIGGLVAITAGCATMEPPYAVLTGAVAGIIATIGPAILTRMRLDDVVDAVSVHAFCGVWGTLAAGLFYSGDMFNTYRIMIQAIGIATAFIWGFGTASITYLLLARIMGIRSNAIHEQRGLDLTEHNEMGYPEFQQLHAFNPDGLNR